MPVQMKWMDESHLILLKFEGVITSIEIDRMDDFVMNCYQVSPSPLVHVIADTRYVTEAASFKKLISLKSVRHPKRGWMITLGAFENPTWRFIAGGITTMFQVRHREAAGLDNAIEILLRVDPSLTEMALLELLNGDFIAG